ncbi:MAG: 3'-5' exonuclease [Proteobacteria bacterium]|nr:3'-5' exonuclease [Pseudomonadota bacterium]
MNIFVFDIETIPDTTSGQQLLGMENLSEESTANAMMSLAKESTGQAFVKHHLQKIVAISVVFRSDKGLRVWSLGERSSTEAELIQRFFAGIDKYKPTLVSWNGGQFDLPVLHYRALYHGVIAPKYWETGENDPSFKWNNYLSRYHARHLDLMDTLAGYNQKSFAKLEDIAVMLGLPGKMGMSGNLVLENYLQGKIDDIRHYCETDVLNTYLIYLRFQLMRGIISPDQYNYEIELTKSTLRDQPLKHLQEFLEAWEANSDRMSTFLA